MTQGPHPDPEVQAHRVQYAKLHREAQKRTAEINKLSRMHELERDRVNNLKQRLKLKDIEISKLEDRIRNLEVTSPGRVTHYLGDPPRRSVPTNWPAASRVLDGLRCFRADIVNRRRRHVANGGMEHMTGVFPADMDEEILAQIDDQIELWVSVHSELYNAVLANMSKEKEQ